MADVEQLEEVETDSTVDQQQLDIVKGDKKTASVAEENVEAEQNGMTGTPLVPIPSSSASSVEDEQGEGAGAERGRVSLSSPRVWSRRG